MAKKNNNIAAKKKTTTAAKPVTPPAEETVIETVSTDENKTVNVSQFTPKNVVGSSRSALDANHKVDLLTLTHKFFKEDPDSGRKYTLGFLDAIDKILAAGIVSALADEAAFGEGSFSMVLNHTMYPQLVVAAKEMGVTLPAAKSLEVKNDGTVEIQKEQVKLDKNVKEELKKEKEIVDENPELDPEKVANLDEEALRKALSYILITGPKTTKVKDTLCNVVDFMRKYRMALAKKAENAADAMLKYDDYTTGQWLDDAFSYVKPTFLLHGIGRGFVSCTSLEKSPVSAFCILRRSLTKDDGTVEWDDQSIADAVKSITIFVAKNCIEQEQKNLDALDPKAKDYKDVSKKYKASIQHYNDCISYLENTGNIVESLVQGVEDGDPVLEKIYQRVRDRYYPGKSREVFKNLDENVAMQTGIILNMFKAPGTRNLNYDESKLSELVQYTKEELEAKKKAELEAKQAEQEQETKND